MVVVAQLVEQRTVTPLVAGSNPVSHPIKFALSGFFLKHLFFIISFMLDLFRIEIDQIDLEVLELLKKRLDLSQKIWEYKLQNNLKIQQNDRWTILLQNLKNHWKNLWISSSLIDDLRSRIHKESLDIQNTLL